MLRAARHLITLFRTYGKPQEADLATTAQGTVASPARRANAYPRRGDLVTAKPLRAAHNFSTGSPAPSALFPTAATTASLDVSPSKNGSPAAPTISTGALPILERSSNPENSSAVVQTVSFANDTFLAQRDRLANINNFSTVSDPLYSYPRRPYVRPLRRSPRCAPLTPHV